jgi:hypothetical protein
MKRAHAILYRPLPTGTEAEGMQCSHDFESGEQAAVATGCPPETNDKLYRPRRTRDHRISIAQLEQFYDHLTAEHNYTALSSSSSELSGGSEHASLVQEATRRLLAAGAAAHVRLSRRVARGLARWHSQAMFDVIDAGRAFPSDAASCVLLGSLSQTHSCTRSERVPALDVSPHSCARLPSAQSATLASTPPQVPWDVSSPVRDRLVHDFKSFHVGEQHAAAQLNQSGSDADDVREAI